MIYKNSKLLVDVTNIQIQDTSDFMFNDAWRFYESSPIPIVLDQYSGVIIFDFHNGHLGFNFFFGSEHDEGTYGEPILHQKRRYAIALTSKPVSLRDFCLHRELSDVSFHLSCLDIKNSLFGRALPAYISEDDPFYVKIIPVFKELIEGHLDTITEILNPAVEIIRSDILRREISFLQSKQVEAWKAMMATLNNIEAMKDVLNEIDVNAGSLTTNIFSSQDIDLKPFCAFSDQNIECQGVSQVLIEKGSKPRVLARLITGEVYDLDI